MRREARHAQSAQRLADPQQEAASAAREAVELLPGDIVLTRGTGWEKLIAHFLDWLLLAA